VHQLARRKIDEPCCHSIGKGCHRTSREQSGGVILPQLDQARSGQQHEERSRQMSKDEIAIGQRTVTQQPGCPEVDTLVIIRFDPWLAEERPQTDGARHQRGEQAQQEIASAEGSRFGHHRVSPVAQRQGRQQ
jgi:hypothetical protein